MSQAQGELMAELRFFSSFEKKKKKKGWEGGHVGCVRVLVVERSHATPAAAAPGSGSEWS